MCDYNFPGDGVASFSDCEVMLVFLLFIFIAGCTVTAVVDGTVMIIMCEIDLNF